MTQQEAEVKAREILSKWYQCPDDHDIQMNDIASSLLASYKSGLSKAVEVLPENWPDNRLINGRTARLGWNEYRKEAIKAINREAEGGEGR